jgi:ketosteroid isomerase-like protein
MSQENVELHRQGLDAWNRRDDETWLALADPNAELIPAVIGMEGGQPLRGRGGARRLWDAWLATFPDAHLQIDEIRDLGDTTLAAVRICGHGARSDLPVEQPAWHVMEWRDRKCVRFQVFLTEAEALEALDQIPPPQHC